MLIYETIPCNAYNLKFFQERKKFQRKTVKLRNLARKIKFELQP